MEQCNVTFNQAGSVTFKTFKDVFLYGCRGHVPAKLHKSLHVHSRFFMIKRSHIWLLQQSRGLGVKLHKPVCVCVFLYTEDQYAFH